MAARYPPAFGNHGYRDPRGQRGGWGRRDGPGGWDRGRGGNPNVRGGRGGYREARDTNPMGFKAVEALSRGEEDLGQMLIKMTNPYSGFKLRIDTPSPLTPEFIANIITAVSKVLAYKGAPETRLQLLNDVRHSQLIKTHLNPFFIRMMSDHSAHSLEIHSQIATGVLEIFKVMLHVMPYSSDQIFEVLTIMEVSIKHMKKNKTLAKDNLLIEIQDMLDQCNEMRDMRQEKNIEEKDESMREDTRLPPNNFREMSVIPTPEDVHSPEKPFLRANKDQGSYMNLDHYLDVQFRLLREDFIRPLREGISHYRRMVAEGIKERTTDIRIYDTVQVLYPICSSNGVCYRIRFNTEKLRVRWEASKRLIFGSLLCMSKDNFQTLIFATVQNRDPKLLQEGELDIRFEHNLADMEMIPHTDIFIMAETTAYFEAYRHVLEGVKNIDDTFPFQQYFVQGQKDVEPPSYVRRRPTANVDLRILCQKKTDSTPIRIDGSDRDSSDDEIFGGMEDVRRRVLAQNTKWMTVHLLEKRTWPSAAEMKLDSTQYEALQAALTKELAIIQGPPGTGKTYIGLKIVSALLKNPALWNETPVHDNFHNLAIAAANPRRRLGHSPILVVCYTNHALDQFLEGISEFCEVGIVRVGGRSKSETMKKYSLRSLRQSIRQNRGAPQEVFLGRRAAQSDMYRLDETMDKTTTQLAACEKGIMHEEFLEDFISRKHYDQLVTVNGPQFQVPKEFRHNMKRASLIVEWLGLGDMFTDEQEQQQAGAEALDEEDDLIDVEEDAQIAEADRILDLDDVQRQMRNMQHDHNVRAADNALAYNTDDVNNQPPPPQGHAEEVWQTQRKSRKKRNRQIRRELQKTTMMTEEAEGVVQDIWQLRRPERWQLYRYWLSQYKARLRGSIRQSEVAYQRTADRLRELLDTEDKGIMQTAKVLGMTTTGAAKYRNILQEVHPKIVIVEEAAEVLEAHIVTTLSEGCKHLILIGDHKQLRPNPTVYELAEKFKLKVSLFERLLNNGMAYVTLGEQHRMRPEISQIMKHIYPNLRDHTSVSAYDNVKGVSKNMFFLDHKFHEDKDDELKSKSNFHEAKFIAAFCYYLLLQGYKQSQITVLTAYTGQIFLLKKQMPKKKFEGVRIAAIDNYQGEENDIILLSLVRSNNDNVAGFLKDDNRLCVALSRARKGLYVMGNFKLLEQSSRLWGKVIQTVKDEESFGPSIPLYCQNHPDDKGIDAMHSKDFEKAPEGGCAKPCGYRLPCGHVCARMCHSYDLDHKEYKCKKQCGKKICNVEGHKCKKPCSAECGDCMIIMDTFMPICGHTQPVPCSIPVARYVCRAKCTKRLPGCGHKCQDICGVDCTPDCRFEVPKTLPCSHTVSLKCFQNPDSVGCSKSCDTMLECGHMCPGTCGRCSRGRVHVACAQNCGRVLVCGHQCDVNCTRECPPCSKPCQNKCVHSECKARCGASCAPCKEPCAWECRHKTCSKMCHEACDRGRCNEPCTHRLDCNHPCIGLCGEVCPTKCRICDEPDVTAIFFGSEDEEDARFVQLQDCGHVFEVSGLDTWMKTNQEGEDETTNIQMKKCPRCSVVIRKNLRYGPIINQILCDIEMVKAQVRGVSDTSNERALGVRIGQILMENMKLQAFDKKSYEIFDKRLVIPVKDMTSGQLECISFAIQVMQRICKLQKSLTKKFSDKVLKAPQNATARAAKQLNKELATFSTWATHGRLRFSEQEYQDAERELDRLKHFLDMVLLTDRIQLREIKIPSSARIKKDEGMEILTAGKRMSDDELKTLKDTIKDLVTHAPLSGLGITDGERIQIVKALGLRQGHWYKCPNGHVYAIGDCGGATQQSKCPECKVGIGGTAYRLVDGNRVASEMDGAQFPAWSEQANLENPNHEFD